jgi:recombinational DNA repair protein (RecF pathway)
MGTRDILINTIYCGKFLCEIQLAITEEVDKKQQAYDAFNHYLYELKRSNLGPIMESACIWAHLDQRSRAFKKNK